MKDGLYLAIELPLDGFAGEKPSYALHRYSQPGKQDQPSSVMRKKRAINPEIRSQPSVSDRSCPVPRRVIE